MSKEAPITPGWVGEQARRLAAAPPAELLRWAVDRFAPRVGLTCSFSGAGVVLAHLLSQVAPAVPVIFLDTSFHFAETLRYKDELAERLGLNLIEHQPKLSRRERALRYGADLYRRDPDLCCALCKVEPMQRALQGRDAWITALRRDQSPTRAAIEPLEYHELPGGRAVVKVMPLYRWQARDVQQYMEQHGIPRHPLLDRGYASIGCAPCTRPVAAGEDERAGRWSGSDKTECGLHTFTRRAEA